MIFKEVKGDLFKLDLDKWTLAHCISADVTATKNMNKGIAKIFRNKYPKMAKHISPHLETGKAIRYQVGNHIIYNLVSKDKVWQKAKGNYKEIYYKNLRQALEDLMLQMISKGETHLAMPRIASGLDGGNWNIISKYIIKIFENTDVEIQIRYL